MAAAVEAHRAGAQAEAHQAGAQVADQAQEEAAATAVLELHIREAAATTILEWSSSLDQAELTIKDMATNVQTDVQLTDDVEPTMNAQPALVSGFGSPSLFVVFFAALDVREVVRQLRP